ncbi:hypothetical protein [Paraburkholderia dipogonis]|uniref:hypothetical protein n=1 Tax=Paraburkholderia dipogonis TaxID=1211383 RepID=UPI0038BA3EC1
MSAQKITDEQWAEARKRYETEPGLGLGKIAQVLDCSKSLVARKAREGKWQKDIGVPNQVHRTAREREAKVTGSAAPRATQAVHVNGAEASTRPAHVVADVFVLPAAEKAAANDYDDEIRVPDGLDEIGREEFVKAAILDRQRAINARHLKEMKAARAQVYAAIKKAGAEGGQATALAVLRIVQAVRAMQEADMEAELQRVRLEVAEFIGKPVKPTPCRIVVHMLPGEQLLGGAKVYGPNAIEVIDVESRNA